MGKKLDDELAEAIKQHDEPPTSAPGVAKAADAPKASAKRSSSLGLLITLLVMVGALTTFFFVGLKPAAIYAIPVDQIVASRAEFVGRKVRIEGELVPGTLKVREQPCEHRFSVKGTKEVLPVRFPQCVIPENLRDVPGEGGVELTVEGAVEKDGTFAATLIMAKCTSRYDPKSHKMGEKPGS